MNNQTEKVLRDPVIDIIIPAYNEENSVGKVINDILMALPGTSLFVIITAPTGLPIRAKEAGAVVVEQPDQGYGNACLAGMSYISNLDKLPDVVVFIDADYSDYPEEMNNIVKPIIEQGYDMVIGSRALGELEPGAMMPQQIFGNWLATNMIKLFYGYEFTDLGPFRAIKWDKLMSLNMIDKTYGWTVEMQVKAAKQKMKCTEVPVTYRKRIGKSKVSGTVKGTIMAGHKILWTIFKLL